jgi:hypothetical protein
MKTNNCAVCGKHILSDESTSYPMEYFYKPCHLECANKIVKKEENDVQNRKQDIRENNKE